MTYGLDPQQLRVDVIRPVLATHDPNDISENLILGTALQESRLIALNQGGGGPALGLWQMEPATYLDCWQNFLQFRPALKAWVLGYTCASNGMLPPPASELTGNLYLACAMARVRYLRVPEILPAASDPSALAAFYKQWYNTPNGAATIEQALPHFQYACGVSAP